MSDVSEIIARAIDPWAWRNYDSAQMADNDRQMLVMASLQKAERVMTALADAGVTLHRKPPPKVRQ